MKIILRTLAILGAALVVVGITFAISRSSVGAALRSNGRNRGAPLQAQPNAAPSADASAAAPAERLRGRPDGGERGGGIFGIAEVLKNLVIIGVIVALVAGLLRVFRQRRRRAPAAIS